VRYEVEKFFPKRRIARQQQLSLGMLLVLVLRLAVILGIIRQLVAFVF